MKCKFCGAELEQENPVCPVCGEKNEKETKQKEHVSPWKIVLATAVVILLLCVLTVVVINSVTERNWPFDLFTKETTAATEPTTEATLVGPEDLGMIVEGITDTALYSAEDPTAIAAADEVVAQLGDYQLTNEMLQVFYWTEFSSFVVEATESGYDVMTAYELDITKPMSEQLVVGSTVTWEQYFLNNALSAWWRYAGVNILADEAGFQISEEDRAALDNIPAQLDEEAVKVGFANAEEMLLERLGANCDLDAYVQYMELTARGDLYYDYFQKNYVPTDDEVKAFFDLNAETYSAYYGLTLNSGKSAAVRHVLLVPEGAEKDASTGYVTATDEQWEAGMTSAQAMLDAWVKKGAKEEDFATMANEHSTDGGSNTNGGLYEGVLPGQMVEPFDAWVFDETRKAGDYGIVKTDFGYHLMYFVSMSEKDAWYEQAYEDAVNYGYGFNMTLNEKLKVNALEPVLDKIVLCDVAQEPVEETTTETTPATTAAAE